MRIVTLDNKSMENILADMLKRDPNNYDSYTQTVQTIVDDVKARGDEALFEYTKRFDGAAMDGNSIRVTREEIDEAMKQVEPGLLKVMERSMDNIRRYHEKQRQNSWFDAQPDGTILGQKVTALESVGVYVPGGKAVQHRADGRAVALSENGHRNSIAKGVFHRYSSMPSRAGSSVMGSLSARQQPRPGHLMTVMLLPLAFLSCCM